MNRPRIIMTSLLFAASAFCLADNNPLVGQFGHDFTRRKDEPAWEIKKDGAQYQLRSVAPGETAQAAHALSDAERRKFWQTMSWPEDTSAAAQCVGDSEHMLCFVPAATRQKIDWLKSNKSDYFYYDQAAGVMQAQKVAH